jgi:hypothetical protein
MKPSSKPLLWTTKMLCCPRCSLSCGLFSMGCFRSQRRQGLPQDLQTESPFCCCPLPVWLHEHTTPPATVHATTVGPLQCCDPPLLLLLSVSVLKEFGGLQFALPKKTIKHHAHAATIKLDRTTAVQYRYGILAVYCSFICTRSTVLYIKRDSNLYHESRVTTRHYTNNTNFRYRRSKMEVESTMVGYRLLESSAEHPIHLLFHLVAISYSSLSQFSDQQRRAGSLKTATSKCPPLSSNLKQFISSVVPMTLATSYSANASLRSSRRPTKQHSTSKKEPSRPYGTTQTQLQHKEEIIFKLMTDD